MTRTTTTHTNDETTETTDDGVTTERLRSTLTASVVGGGMATLVMTVFRAPTARSLPPTADFLSRWVGGSTDDYPVSSLALHFLYGIVGGVPFGLAWPRVARRVDEPEVVGLIAGSLYGLAMSVFGERVVLRYLVGMDLDTDESAVFHAGHLVYGLTLGAWVGSRSPD